MREQLEEKKKRIEIRTIFKISKLFLYIRKEKLQKIKKIKFDKLLLYIPSTHLCILIQLYKH